MGRLIAALLAVLLLAVPGAAQDADLDRVDSLIASGEYAAARSAVEQWWRAVEGGKSVSSEARARAHLLRARLAPDFRSAERDYLAVALGHPTTPYAPQALLSLGQGYLASGDIGRAVSYLKRLVDDYPRTNLRPVGLLWAARARRLDGDITGACAAARAGLAVAESDLAVLLRMEERVACAPADLAEAGPSARADADGGSDRRTAPAERASTDAAGRFAVQSGAFRRASGAESLAARLRAAGFEPRLVFVSGSDLLRVRVGRFTTAAAAEAVAARLRSAGFPAVVVNDAHQERQSR